jgi:hypothetical protein
VCAWNFSTFLFSYVTVFLSSLCYVCASVPVSRLSSVTKGESCGRFFVRAGEIEDVAGMKRPALPMAYGDAAGLLALDKTERRMVGFLQLSQPFD